MRVLIFKVNNERIFDYKLSLCLDLHKTKSIIKYNLYSFLSVIYQLCSGIGRLS